jgi:hypothetical protein
MTFKHELATNIPLNFPRDNYASALSGAQPKLAMVEIDGKFYPEGNTPMQQLERYLMCEDLAHQSLEYCNRKIKEGVVADPNAALFRLFSGLQSKNWCTPAQKKWIVHRVAELGNWSKPDLK